MNKTTRLLFIGAGLVLAVFAAMLTTGGKEQPKVKKRQIVVALEDIWPGDTVSPEQIAMKRVPAESIPKGAFTKPSMAVGRSAANPIFKNEPVLEERLMPENAIVEVGLPSLPPNTRAVSLRVDEISGISGLLKPDDLVDVIAVSSIPEGPLDKTARVLLEQVRILWVSNSGESENQASRNWRGVVTLSVTAEQAAVLASVEKEKLLLAGRNSRDATRTSGFLATWSLAAGAKLSQPGEGFSQPGHPDLENHMRGVTIPYTEKDGVCGFLHPGQKVDIMAVTDKGSVATESPTPGAKGVFLNSETMSRIILQDVKIIAVSKNKPGANGEKSPLETSQPDAPGAEEPEEKADDDKKDKDGDSDGQAPESGSQAEMLGTVTLLLSPKDAEKLVMAQQASILKILTRNSQDQERIKSQGTKLVELFFKSVEERIYGVEFYPGPKEGVIPFNREKVENGPGRSSGRSLEKQQNPSPMI